MSEVQAKKPGSPEAARGGVAEKGGAGDRRADALGVPGGGAAESSVEHACLRGLSYRALGTGFRYPREDVLEDARALGEVLQAGGVGGGPYEALAHDVAALLRTLAGRGLEAAEEGYTSVFGHLVSGACPPYEGEYGTAADLQFPHLLADLGSLYEAFGLRLARNAAERLDALAVEADFMAFLCAKEGHALEVGDAELLSTVRKAQGLFLEEHLGRWVPAFQVRLERNAKDPLYAALGRWARRFVEVECEAHGAEKGSEDMKLRVALYEPDACLSCPLAKGDPEVVLGGP